MSPGTVLVQYVFAAAAFASAGSNAADRLSLIEPESEIEIVRSNDVSMAGRSVSNAARLNSSKISVNLPKDFFSNSFVPAVDFTDENLTAGKLALISKLWTFVDESVDQENVDVRLRDIDLAYKIICAIPDDIQLPTLMYDEDGKLGMYWNRKDPYADLEIDEDGSVSFFSKVRSTGWEEYHEGINPAEITADWAHKHLSLMLANRPLMT